MSTHSSAIRQAMRPDAADPWTKAVRLADLHAKTASAVVDALLASPRRAMSILDAAGVTALDLAHDDMSAIHCAARWFTDRPPAHWIPAGTNSDDIPAALRSAFGRLVVSALRLVDALDPNAAAHATGSHWSFERIARRLCAYPDPLLKDLPLLAGRLVYLRNHVLERGV